MFRIKYLLFTIFLVSVTGNSVLAQDQKQYDEEIGTLVRKIQQYPGREKYLVELNENYLKANNICHEQVTELRKTGQPDIWYEIYTTYLQLDNRQKLVMQLPEKSVQDAGIVFIDYKENLKESKYKALAYLHAHGERLLQSEKPEDARQAYADLMKAASLDGSFINIDKDIRLAILKGATSIEFELQNRTGKSISPATVEQLTVIIREFNKARSGLPKPDSTDQSFAFILRVSLEELVIGPDQVRELEYQEERDVLNGDVVVDTIKCLVSETRQLKKAQLKGSLEYVEKRSGNVVNRVPIQVETIFSNAYATLQGNPDAAGEETRKLLKAAKAGYPGSDQMVRDVTEEFTKKAREIIRGE
jgi:hypothetical protein